MNIDEFVTITRKEYEGLKSLVLQRQEELRLLKNGKNNLLVDPFLDKSFEWK